MRTSTRLIAGLITLLTMGSAAWADEFDFPAGFKTQQIATNGTTLSDGQASRCFPGVRRAVERRCCGFFNRLTIDRHS